MNTETTFEDRLTRLENQNRRLRRIGITLAALLSAVPLLGFAFSDEPSDGHFRIVYASKFALKDPRTDKIRGEFSHQTVPGGWAGLTLWDDEGQPRAEFKLWEDGRTALLMSDEQSGAKTRLAVDAEGAPSLTINGRPVLVK